MRFKMRQNNLRIRLPSFNKEKGNQPQLMQQIRIHLKDIFNFGGKEFEPGSISIRDISAQLKITLPFLPEPSHIEIEGTDAVLTFNPPNKAKEEESQRLLAKGIKRAEEGSYEKAIGIFKSVLDLDPLLIK